MIWTIRNIDNEVMHEVEAETFLKAVEKKKANLTGADLTGANLRDADLTGANLTGANLTGADLTGANLRDANLRGANLRELLISNSVAVLLQIGWDRLPDSLTLEMMAHDAESCGIAKMDLWAKQNVENKNNICPFNGRIRDYSFVENYTLWYNAKQKDKVPKLRGMKLLIALCNEKGIKTEGIE